MVTKVLEDLFVSIFRIGMCKGEEFVGLCRRKVVHSDPWEGGGSDRDWSGLIRTINKKRVTIVFHQ
jgi:hypothetical protein